MYATPVSVSSFEQVPVLTSRDLVHLVLNEEIHERHQRSEEAASKQLPPPDGAWVRWAKRQTPQRPGQRSDEVRDHEDVVPVMVVG